MISKNDPLDLSRIDSHEPGTGRRLLSLARQAKAKNAALVQLSNVADSYTCGFYKRGENKGSWTLIEQGLISDLAFLEITDAVSRVACKWPGVKTPPKANTVIVRTSKDCSLVFDSVIRNYSGGSTLTLANIREINGDYFDSLDLDCSTIEMLSRLSQIPTGIVFTRNAKAGVIDGASLAFASCPHALFFRGELSAKTLVPLYSQAESRLVIVETSGKEPFYLLTELMAELAGNSSSLQTLVSLTRAAVSCICVRNLCKECKQPKPGALNDVERAMFSRLCRLFRVSQTQLYERGPGCDNCKGSGLFGSGLFVSLIEIDRDFRELLQQGASHHELLLHAYRRGTNNLTASVGEFVLNGLQPLGIFSLLAKDLLSVEEEALESFIREQKIEQEKASSSDAFSEMTHDFFTDDYTPSKTAEQEPEDTVSQMLASIRLEDLSVDERARAGRDTLPSLNILIAEDDPKQRHILRLTLKSQGYEVICAENGQEALELLKHKDVQMVISDYHMPLLDGAGLVKSIRENPQFSHLPILMLTSETDETVEQSVRALGADDYCHKTIKRQELLDRLESVVEKHREACPLEHWLD